MYKIFLAFIFLFTGSLHAMDNPHDHGSHKHSNMTGVQMDLRLSLIKKYIMSSLLT